MDKDKQQNQTGATAFSSDHNPGRDGSGIANVGNYRVKSHQSHSAPGRFLDSVEKSQNSKSTKQIMAARFPALPAVATLFPGSNVRSPTSITTVLQLGQMIRQARESRKLTQQEFADLAGVGRRFLSELENGKSTAEFGKVLSVAQAAGLDLFAKVR